MTPYMPIPSLSPVHLCRLASVTFAHSFTKMTYSLPTSTLDAQRKTRLRCHRARYEVASNFPELIVLRIARRYLLTLIVYTARLVYSVALPATFAYV